MNDSSAIVYLNGVVQTPAQYFTFTSNASATGFTAGSDTITVIYRQPMKQLELFDECS